MLTNEELDQTIESFGAHCHEGSLLILDLRNAASFLVGGFTPRIEGDVVSPALTAHYVAEHEIDARRQLLIRKRTWRFPNGSVAEDYCEYRLLFPEEIAWRLSHYGFKVLGMYDNKELRETKFSGPTMYVVSEFAHI